jgi:hypothetical protein
VLALVGAGAALGTLAIAVYALFRAADGVRATLRDQLGMSRRAVDLLVEVHLTGWLWLALVGSVAALAAFGAAVRWSPSWPGMARRYDAPGGRSAAGEPSTNLEIWKAIDEGHDPTA